MSTSKITSIADSIINLITGDTESLKDYSERSSIFIYEYLSDYLSFDTGKDKEMEEFIRENTRYIRDGLVFDKLSSDFLWEIQQAVNTALEAKGYKTSKYGYWHKGPYPLIAFWEAKIRDAFVGAVFSITQDSCSYVTGEAWLESWDTWEGAIDCFPSSPYEAFDLASECDGFFETEWQYVLSNLREEMCSLDLTEYEDVDEVLTQVEFGLCFEDFPRDYREQLTDMFEEMKEEHAEEEEIEEEYE